MIFVVGEDGTIGSALMDELRARRLPAFGSSRRRGAGRFLDLQDPGFVITPVPDVTIVCAAVATVAACETDPAASRRVNVEGTLELARYLAGCGSSVIALSTNQVFNGTAPRIPAAAKRNPVTEYGRQKAEMEEGILGLGEGGSIVRLTKVLSPGMSLFSAWRTNLENGLEIEPFADMSLAPIALESVTDSLIMLALRRLSGIFQLSATNDISYAAAALRLCRSMECDERLVRPRPSNVLAPLYTSLETTRAERELNWDARTAEAILDAHFAPRAQIRTSMPAARSQDV